MESRFKKLTILFTTAMTISATSNGGYAIAAAFKNRFVDHYHWLSEEDMVNYMSLGQSCPGPIAVSTATLVGYGISGFLGAIVALLGTIIPPVLIMSLVAVFYNLIADNRIMQMAKVGMQAGVVALIVSITIDLFINATKEKSPFSYGMILFALFVVRLTSIPVFYLVLFCGCAGILKMTYDQKEKKHE